MNEGKTRFQEIEWLAAEAIKWIEEMTGFEMKEGDIRVCLGVDHVLLVHKEDLYWKGEFDPSDIEDAANNILRERGYHRIIIVRRNEDGSHKESTTFRFPRNHATAEAKLLEFLMDCEEEEEE